MTMSPILHPNSWRHLWQCATGPINRDPAEVEPQSLDYLLTLTGLLFRRRLHLATYLWGLRARPACICGIGGTFSVASWVGEMESAPIPAKTCPAPSVGHP